MSISISNRQPSRAITAANKQNVLMITSLLKHLDKKPLPTGTGIMTLHFTVSLWSALGSLRQDEAPGQEELVVLSWKMLHGLCHPWGVLVLLKTMPCQSEPRPTRNQGTGLNPESGKLQNHLLKIMPCQSESRPNQSQGLNPESGKFLGAMVEPHSGCLELSGVTVLTAFLTDLLKGLDS